VAAIKRGTGALCRPSSRWSSAVALNNPETARLAETLEKVRFLKALGADSRRRCV
jgi:hypothetical protein